MNEIVKSWFSPHFHHLGNRSVKGIDSLMLQFCQPKPFKPLPSGSKRGLGVGLDSVLLCVIKICFYFLMVVIYDLCGFPDPIDGRSKETFFLLFLVAATTFSGLQSYC